MKTRGIIGQKIVHVEQSMCARGSSHPPQMTLHYIKLENGILLIPMVYEGEADYFVDMAVNKTALKRRRSR